MERIDLVWFAVVNPHAGSGKTLSLWQKAETLIRQKQIPYEYRTTDCKFHATEMAYSAAKEGFRRFIAVGGDGTVHEVLDGIMRCISDMSLKGESVTLSDFTLAVIPIGSGNDWIKSHHVPYDVEEVVDMIADGSFSMQDIVKVSASDPVSGAERTRFSYMINIGGTGLDSRICERVNVQKDAGKSGKLLYVKSLIYNLIHSKIFSARVECDGKTIYRGKCLSIAFGIGKYSGGGFRQTPEAIMDDGLTEVTVIPPLPIHRMVVAACRLVDGTFLKLKEVVSYRCHAVSVFPEDGVAGEIVEVDGEIVGAVPVTLENLPQRLQVLHKD